MFIYLPKQPVLQNLPQIHLIHRFTNSNCGSNANFPQPFFTNITFTGQQQTQTLFQFVPSPVKLPYISSKNLAKVVHITHYLQESCKNLRFQTNLSDSGRSDISCRFRRFLQGSCRSRLFLQDSWTDLARQCLKLERYSAKKCLE